MKWFCKIGSHILEVDIYDVCVAGAEPEEHEDMTHSLPQHGGRAGRADLRVEEHLEEEEGEEEEEEEERGEEGDHGDCEV